MNDDTPVPTSASWGEVFLVCKQCRKRRNGPKGFKSQQAAHEAKHALRSLKPRPRVLLTSCLGLCPKSAMAIARVGGQGGARIAAVSSLGQIERLLPQMSDRPGTVE